MESLRKFLGKNTATNTKSMIVISLNNVTSAMYSGNMYGNYTTNIGRDNPDPAKAISGQITGDCKSFSLIFKILSKF